MAPILAVVIFVTVAWLLYRNLRSYSIEEIRQSFLQIPRSKIYLAAALTVANYLCLALFDRLAFKAAGVKLSTGKIAGASLAGYAASYSFGALLGGASIRYRLYSTWRLTASDILKVMLMIAIGGWSGMLTVAAAAFLGTPLSSGSYATSLRLVGVCCASLVVAYLVTTLVRKQPIRFGHYAVQLPRFRVAVAQAVVSTTELTLAAAALWILLPDELSIPFRVLLAGYMMAVFATIASHAPGGLGVFELVVLSYVIPTKSPAAVAALVLYRIIYYFMPLAIAAVGYIAFEWRRQKERLLRTTAKASRLISPVAPWMLSALVFLCGLILLLSGATPVEHSRLTLISQWLPIHAVEMGHLIGSVVGTLLLVLSHGLSRRFDSAWWTSMVLVSIGVVASLMKGIDWEEAGILVVVLILLAMSRSRFYRRGAMLHSVPSAKWWVAVALTLTATIWLGSFAYKHVEYSNDLWWHFAYDANAPRFLRASLVAATILLVLASISLQGKSREIPPLPTVDEISRATEVVAHQSSTEANLALLGDKSLLWSDDRTAFVMFAVRGASWIALGDPVGPIEQHEELVWRFRELADSHGGRTVFHHVPAMSLPSYLQVGSVPLKIGDAGQVALESFSLDAPKLKSLRRVHMRFERQGFQFHVVPAHEVRLWLPQLRLISEEWLAAKHTAEKRFSLGFFSEDYLCRLPIALVTKNGDALAFANVLVTNGREELSIDMMRHCNSVPNGIMDYLFGSLMLWGKEQGYKWFSLGVAPLSGLDSRPLSPLWNKIGNALYEHGEHFYNYEGLRQYKEKFSPQWQPMYLCYPGGFCLPQVLIDFAALNSGGIRGVVSHRGSNHNQRE
ncbi:bifunctional lysylphosphatidylglycerol flippase/synthetase MprF [Lacipirellula parvula]|uniref:bifunctional lysylphosphatidylglycerol flippase/synthetase MprF n=1 Tax=Lacipirellula parvula TaxID=2650471 RepID=UPI0015623C84|nr:bifunctional lysylphosphatidylglycerol flippase/synthetase MprF [Lacipirellula parvula]